MGLFGISKKKERLLEIQSIVVKDAPTKRLIMSEKQLLDELARMAQRDLDIIQDCTRILGKTKDPDAFFMRLNLLAEKADNLRTYGKYLSFSGADPTAAYASYWEERQECIHQFLFRCYSDACDKAAEAKTAKGKMGKYQKYLDKLQQYYDQMDLKNQNYVKSRFEASIDMLSKETKKLN